jgi:hypothetical protein
LGFIVLRFGLKCQIIALPGAPVKTADEGGVRRGRLALFLFPAVAPDADIAQAGELRERERPGKAGRVTMPSRPIQFL